MRAKNYNENAFTENSLCSMMRFELHYLDPHHSSVAGFIFLESKESPLTEPIKFPTQPKFSKEQELYSRLHDLVHEYDGELSMVAVVGIVELLKLHVVEVTK